MISNVEVFMKYIACIIVCIFLTIALRPSFAEELGNARKGKYLYRKNCLSCHQYGTKNQLGPDSKKRAEWKAAFSKEQIKGYSCAEHWSKLTEKDVLDIYTHMYERASDSPAPASCK